MATEANPTMARRRLALRLSAIRLRKGRSLDELASVLSVSLAQASRLDTGARGFQVPQIDTLADWYSIDDDERALLLGLVTESRKRAWWQQVDLDDSYRTLIGLEQGATSISEYCGSVLPGLLQTFDYSLASAETSSFDVERGNIEQAAVVRGRRQEILLREPRPLLWVIMDEAVLARTAGGADVMAPQLEHLLDMSIVPRTTVQVVGFEAGAHLGTTSLHFILLGMGNETPDVVYSEGMSRPMDTDDPAVVEPYRRKWGLLSALALDPQTSRSRIKHYLAALRR